MEEVAEREDKDKSEIGNLASGETFVSLYNR